MRFRFLYFIFCAASGVAVAWTSQPYVHDNSDATTVIVTVMTVLAGFMIAIITILGDPSTIPPGSWRIVANREENIENKIIRHIWLFVLYLLSLAFLFAGTIFRKVPSGPIIDTVKVWVDYGYVFLGVTAFLLSFSLPFSILKIQKERLELEKERRKAEALKQARVDPGDTTD